MRKTAGFTLIELVIVIVILGILGAVAAPKLFNLQGDAYGANLNAMKSSIASAMTMANAKAQIEGSLTVTGADTGNSIKGYTNIAFTGGYPNANKKVITADGTTPVSSGILATLDGFDASRYDVVEVTDANPAAITITPKAATNPDTCKVTYTQAVAAKAATESDDVVLAIPAKVEAVTDGC